MTILDKSQNDKKDELIVNTSVIPSEVEESHSYNVIPSEVEESHPNVMSTEVETSHPQCHPESVAKRSREDLNPSVIPTNNVISTEVETSNPHNVMSTAVETSNP